LAQVGAAVGVTTCDVVGSVSPYIVF